jgi:hypothetical protein
MDVESNYLPDVYNVHPPEISIAPEHFSGLYYGPMAIPVELDTITHFQRLFEQVKHDKKQSYFDLQPFTQGFATVKDILSLTRPVTLGKENRYRWATQQVLSWQEGFDLLRQANLVESNHNKAFQDNLYTELLKAKILQLNSCTRTYEERRHITNQLEIIVRYIDYLGDLDDSTRAKLVNRAEGDYFPLHIPHVDADLISIFLYSQGDIPLLVKQKNSNQTINTWTQSSANSILMISGSHHSGMTRQQNYNMGTIHAVTASRQQLLNPRANKRTIVMQIRPKQGSVLKSTLDDYTGILDSVFSLLKTGIIEDDSTIFHGIPACKIRGRTSDETAFNLIKNKILRHLFILYDPQYDPSLALDFINNLETCFDYHSIYSSHTFRLIFLDVISKIKHKISNSLSLDEL